MKTQKAYGMQALAGFGGQGIGRILEVLGFIASKEDWAKLCGWAKPQFPLFARPCPKTPRHGFVDSRLVKDEADLMGLLEATLAADPEGEVMLTPAFKNVSGNAIWTPALMTLGDSNDGATAGKDVISIPLVRATEHHDGLPEGLKTLAKIANEQDPYVEAIYLKQDKDRMESGLIITQLRAGERVESVAPDQIPAEMTVARVIKAGGDLLEWENTMASAKGEVGVVVWHPGGSLTDHFAVHARTNKVALVTTHEPTIGEVLVPMEAPKVLDPLAMLAGAAAADQIPITFDNSLSATALLLVGLHNSAAMAGSSSAWIGAAATLLLRMGSCALRGEARHVHRANGYGSSIARESVYKRHWNRRISFHRAANHRLINVHRYGQFGGPGVGGMKWAMCGVALAPLFNAVRKLAIQQDEAAANELLMALNVAVHQVHNGGWWLNKFISIVAMDRIQQGAYCWTLSAGKAALAVGRAQQAMGPEQLQKWIQRVAGWPVTVTPPPPIKAANLEFDATSQSAIVQFSIPHYPGRTKNILIPLASIRALKGTVDAGAFFLTLGDSGQYQVTFQKATGDRIVLHEEKPLHAAKQQKLSKW